jgi:hypothetical protein
MFAIRQPDGNLLEDGGRVYWFVDKADAIWFAQRRTRLSEYTGFGGRRKLFIPSISRIETSSDGRVFTILGELGAVQVTGDGRPVGPVWAHPTNGLVDAWRYAKRAARRRTVVV